MLMTEISGYKLNKQHLTAEKSRFFYCPVTFFVRLSDISSTIDCGSLDNLAEALQKPNNGCLLVAQCH